MPKSTQATNGRAGLADRRRAELLEAARQVVLERGMASTRIADIAKATNVSGGLVHYHFATKDELMAEMLRATSELERRQLDQIVAGRATALERLDRVIRHYIPRTRGDQSWVLWIEAWAASLHAPALRAILAELERAWVAALERVIRDGVVSGEFSCPDPGAAADRLDALVDGLMIRCTVDPDAMSRRRLLEHARTAAAREVGLPRQAFPA
ncbi:MAG TPA: TetR family transcriptional regulator C-terminal domain-containing protein [Micromonosporaceae bacterium]|nr:TetR family transcriptional regulator C-terminal domain-containing protein [Micromonosporaceae bacterium]